MTNVENLSLKHFTTISMLTIADRDAEICVRGYVQMLRCTGKCIFIVLRDQLETLQCVIAKPTLEDKGLTRQQFNELKKVTLESFIEVTGKIVGLATEISGCSKKDVELQVYSYELISLSDQKLPFCFKDASATEHERNTNGTIQSVSYHLCLNNRSLYLRTPHSYSIFRVIDGVMHLFRSFLRKNGFMEIKTPKLIGASSEGGANVFKVKYFKDEAYLAQSPQLYKQMAIIGGLKRVYEVGHVYRAEESNINRYLSEFIGLDLEMELPGSYTNLINFIYSMFVEIFDGIKTEYGNELKVIRAYRNFDDIVYSKEPVVLTHREAVNLLRSKNIDVSYDDDFNSENEKKLGTLVKEKHGVDFFVIKDYPASTRPFYTYVDSNGLTRSYDFIFRGEEILSGAQRIHDYLLLHKAVKDRGISTESLGGYLEAFKYGTPRHGGCGIGLERLMKAYFGFNDIRHFSLFPRDPNRLYP